MGLTDRVGELLPTLDAAFPTSVVEGVTAFLADAAGATKVTLWLSDYNQDVLGGLSGPTGTVIGEHIAAGDGPTGTAYLTQEQVLEESDDKVTVHTPISLRGDRLGVLSVEVPAPADADTRRGLGEVALVLAYVVTLAPRYTDAFEQARRRRPLNLAAETQWAMLQVRAFSAEQFTLAGRVTPAYDVGGDVYDCCVDPGTLWVTVADAMGHRLPASMLSSLAVNAIRNARRCGLGLVEQASAASEALAEVFGDSRFVTGIILQIALDTGDMLLLNAGHPPAYRVRGGVTDVVYQPPDAPMGALDDITFTAARQRLEPGDRLVLVSDGVIEGPLADGEQYGDVHLEGQIAGTAALTAQGAAEALQRHLGEFVGERLHDDATVVVLDWHGPRP
jgi:serine phosphatase RsbU (regulator of sigma subunit)